MTCLLYTSTAKRLGAEATIGYRRSEKELPARGEEVHHAKEEGIEFRMLTNPTSIIGDEKGWVVGISCEMCIRDRYCTAWRYS